MKRLTSQKTNMNNHRSILCGSYYIYVSMVWSIVTPNVSSPKLFLQKIRILPTYFVPNKLQLFQKFLTLSVYFFSLNVHLSWEHWLSSFPGRNTKFIKLILLYKDDITIRSRISPSSDILN